jgi:hypothetical protein
MTSRSSAEHLASLILAALVAFAVPAFAQTKPAAKPASSPASDRLGMTCAQILAMTSTDWTTKFTEAKASTPDAAGADTRAIATYGKCYDGHTDVVAATLTKKGSGPTKKARADFVQFESAAKAFTMKALADAQPTPDATKSAYVNLYEKQFRREFYTEYGGKTVNRPLTSDESDAYHKAKNRFGELIGLLPEDKGHEVHEAFGDIVGSHPVSMPMNLALYRYAIFILEPASEKPFGPPPF